MTQMPGYPCAVCSRSGGSITINENNNLTMLCSHDCARIWITRGPEMKHDEVKACEVGGQAAGEYLDSIGKTDLANLTPAEWATFCQTLFRSTCAELARQADDSIPF